MPETARQTSYRDIINLVQPETLCVQCLSQSVVLSGVAWGAGNPTFNAWVEQEVMWICGHYEDGILNHFVQRNGLHNLLVIFFYVFQARHVL